MTFLNEISKNVTKFRKIKYEKKNKQTEEESQKIQSSNDIPIIIPSRKKRKLSSKDSSNSQQIKHQKINKLSLTELREKKIK